VAEVKCDHDHVAEVEGEDAEERVQVAMLQKLGHRLFGLEIVPFLSYNTVCNLLVCLKGSKNEKIPEVKMYQRYLRTEKNRRLRALKANCRLYLDASDKSSFQLDGNRVLKWKDQLQEVELEWNAQSSEPAPLLAAGENKVLFANNSAFDRIKGLFIDGPALVISINSWKKCNQSTYHLFQNDKAKEYQFSEQSWFIPDYAGQEKLDRDWSENNKSALYK